MRDFSWKTKAYIIVTIISGSVIFTWILLNHNVYNYWALLALSGLASLTLFFKVEGTTNRSHYNISFLVYGFSFVILGPETAIAVILISNLVEWIWQKYSWYIQGFNIASYIVVTFASGLIYKLINPGMSLLTFESILGVLTTMAIFTLLNHLMIGIVIWFARGESFSKSGIFDIVPLMIDFTLLCMGASIALTWKLNPFAAPLIILPLYLIFITLKVPALERETEIDPKTGIYNAKYFSEVLKKELDRAHSFNRPLTVVLADLDLLRNINNTYGHLAGDEVIIGIANFLKNSLREYDIVARFGGEEFIILMPETTPQDAYQYIEKLRTSIETTEFSVPTSITPLKVTVSFGIAGRKYISETPNDIVHNADSALYHSKIDGRNRTCIYADEGLKVLFGKNTEQSLSHRENTKDEQGHDSVLNYPPRLLRNNNPQENLPSGNSKQPSQTNRKHRPAWLINLYIGTLILIVLPISLFLNMSTHNIDWLGLFLFTLMVVLTEGLSISIYVKDASVSMSAAPILAGTLIYGPLGVVVLSLTSALVAKLKHHSPLNRFVFNSLNQMIAGFLVSSVIMVAGKPFTENSLVLQLLLCVISAMIVYISTTLLIALAININASVPLRQVWKEKFGWLSPYYVAMGLIAYALIFSFQNIGWMGLIAVLIPLLMLRFSVKQYIERTIAVVNELRGKNTHLEKTSHEINQLNEDLLNALAEVIDLRDPFSLGHSQFVTRYAVLIAKKIELSPEGINLIRKAGLIHDIGKIGIQDTIFLKPYPLTPEEFTIIQSHTTLGADILENAHSLKHLSPIVRHHHERFDGSGYPDGFRGNEIPLEARIIAVADAVEAMASDRPYRRALSAHEIEQELKKNSGTQFDPVIARVMLDILKTRNEYPLVNSAQKLTVEQCEYAFASQKLML